MVVFVQKRSVCAPVQHFIPFLPNEQEPITAQKMKFFIKHFFSKCDQIHFLRIWPHLRKKSLMENLIFCVVRIYFFFRFCHWSQCYLKKEKNLRRLESIKIRSLFFLSRLRKYKVTSNNPNILHSSDLHSESGEWFPYEMQHWDEIRDP